MSLSKEKSEKLMAIAKLYYEENKTQNEIAQSLKISRPLVSRYLSEAREYGIVKIQIQNPIEERKQILDKLQHYFGIRGGAVIETRQNAVDTNSDIAKVIINGLEAASGMTIGIGWGYIIGIITEELLKRPARQLHTVVYPLVADSHVFNRNYHCNKIASVLATQTGGQIYKWEAPAFVDSPEEMKHLKESENYHQMEIGWRAMKIAFVNIGNYPSVPDFATAARYGSKLADKKAVGKLLCYYYDIHGNIIKSDLDCTMQIPLEILAKRKFVVGICGSNVHHKALTGALKTGIFTHIVASKEILERVLIEIEKKEGIKPYI